MSETDSTEQDTQYRVVTTPTGRDTAEQVYEALVERSPLNERALSIEEVSE